MPEEEPRTNLVECPLVYEDELGSVETTCRSDGHCLVFDLRGRTFRGRSFNLLDVDGSQMEDLPRDRFPVDERGDLVARFTMTLPVAVVGSDDPTAGLVLVFAYRDANAIDGTLTVDGVQYRADAGWVEDVLIQIQRQLPAGVFIACCLSCRWSHYDPLGNNSFGDLACVVDLPDAATASAKGDVFRLWRGPLEYTQETWHCPRFRLLQPGEWAYKDWGLVDISPPTAEP
ncbi:MAG: DUF6304 family protein [Micrococcales bacterium]|nr:DUF6304 family protein [Micrococcales bacterium]